MKKLVTTLLLALTVFTVTNLKSQTVIYDDGALTDFVITPDTSSPHSYLYETWANYLGLGYYQFVNNNDTVVPLTLTREFPEMLNSTDFNLEFLGEFGQTGSPDDSLSILISNDTSDVNSWTEVYSVKVNTTWNHTFNFSTTNNETFIQIRMYMTFDENGDAYTFSSYGFKLTDDTPTNINLVDSKNSNVTVSDNILSIKETGNYSVSIYDITGKIVKQLTNTNTINISDLNGLYFVNVTSENNNNTHKFIF